MSNCYCELKKELFQNDVQHSCCDIKIVKFVENIWGYESVKYNFDPWVRNIKGIESRNPIILFRAGRQILLLILNEFNQIDELLFLLKSTENHRFSDNFRGN